MDPIVEEAIEAIDPVVAMLAAQWLITMLVGLGFAGLFLWLYLGRPRVSYVRFPVYEKGEFAVLVINHDAAPLGGALSFEVFGESIRSVRAFPVSTPNAISVAPTSEQPGVVVTLRELREDRSIMVVLEHSQPASHGVFAVGDCRPGKNVIAPRWRELPPFSGWTRRLHVSTRVLLGWALFVSSYAAARTLMATSASKDVSLSWDAAVLAAGMVAVVFAVFIAGMHRGRWAGIPFEAEGTSIKVEVPEPS